MAPNHTRSYSFVHSFVRLLARLLAEYNEAGLEIFQNEKPEMENLKGAFRRESSEIIINKKADKNLNMGALHRGLPFAQIFLEIPLWAT